MNRTQRDNRPVVKPVEKVTLKDNNNLKRLIIVICFVLIAIGCFGYAIYQALKPDVGFQIIQANNSTNSCKDDFVLTYNIGYKTSDATIQKKDLTNLYSKLCQNAYELFTNDILIDNVSNIRYINEHVNEEIVVDPVLYNALEIAITDSNRSIYLAEIYRIYDQIFYLDNDVLANEYNPAINKELYQFFNQILTFANSDKTISLQLLGDNKVKLFVSQEYLDFCQENDIVDFIDFYWTKNAYIIDYLASELKKAGFVNGTISSYDGFTVTLDDSGEEYNFSLYNDGNIVSIMQYSKPMSIVNLMNYPTNSWQNKYYYLTSDGTYLTPYISNKNSLCQSSLNNIVIYSPNLSCSELLCKIIPIYIKEDFYPNWLLQIEGKIINTIYFGSSSLFYSQYDIKLVNTSDLYEEIYQK